MQMVSVNKAQFAGLNDKRFYFHNGIVSLLSGNFLLNKVREQTEKYKTETQHQIHDKKYDFLKEEAADDDNRMGHSMTSRHHDENSL